MAVLNQLTVSGTTYDLNDKRISKTAVTTATHLLTCNSDVTSIAPITAANLASVLGAFEHATERDNTTSLDDLPEGSIRLIGTRNEGRPDGTEGSLLVCITFFKPIATGGGGLIQVAFKWLGAPATAMTIYVRQTYGDGKFCPWNTLS